MTNKTVPVNLHGDSIKIIHNFLSSQECDLILHNCNDFKTTKVFNNKEKNNIIDSHFINTGIHYFKKNDPVVFNILERTGQIINCNLNQIEPPQCVRYESGYEYNAHFDAFLPGAFLEKYGNRTYTLIIYLNDNFIGGQTYFPQLNLTVNPVKGSALVWKNIDNSGNILNESLHSCLPVIAGVKYIISLWVREFNFIQ